MHQIHPHYFKVLPTSRGAVVTPIQEPVKKVECGESDKVYSIELSPETADVIYSEDFSKAIWAALVARQKEVEIHCGPWKGEKLNTENILKNIGKINQLKRNLSKFEKTEFIAQELLLKIQGKDFFPDIEMNAVYKRPSLFSRSHLYIRLKDTSTINYRDVLKSSPPEISYNEDDEIKTSEIIIGENILVENIDEIITHCKLGYKVSLKQSDHKNNTNDTKIEILLNNKDKNNFKVNIQSPITDSPSDILIPLISRLHDNGISTSVYTVTPSVKDETLELEITHKSSKYDKQVEIFINDFRDRNFEDVFCKLLEIFMLEEYKINMLFGEEKPESQEIFQEYLSNRIKEKVKIESKEECNEMVLTLDRVS